MKLLDCYCGAGGVTRGFQLAGFHVTGVDIAAQKRYCGDAFHQGDAIQFIREHGHEFDAIAASPPCQAHSVLKHMPNAKKHEDLVGPTRDALIATGKPYVIENVPGAPLRNPTVLCGTMFGLGTGDAELRRHRLFETNWPLVLPFGMFCKHGRRAATISVHDDQGRGHDEAEIHRQRNGVKTVTVAGGACRQGDWFRVRVRAGLVKPCKTITVVGSHGTPGLSLARQKSRTITVTGPHGDAGQFGAAKEAREAGMKLIYFSSAERNEAMAIDWMKGGEISQAIPPPYCHFIGLQLMAWILRTNAGGKT